MFSHSPRTRGSCSLRVARPMSAHFASLLVAGGLDALTYWSLAFLIAAGLTVVFGMLGFLNVAHASFYMLAGYIAFTIAGATGSFWLALLLAPPATALGGLIVERPALPPSLRGRAYAATPADRRNRLCHR